MKLQFSLVQILKVVAFCAVGLACIGPMVRLAANSGTSVTAALLFIGVAVPVVWVALSRLLVRRGIHREQLILLFLLCSATTALTGASFIAYQILAEILVELANGSPGAIELRSYVRDFLIVSFIVLFMAGALVALGV